MDATISLQDKIDELSKVVVMQATELLNASTKKNELLKELAEIDAEMLELRAERDALLKDQEDGDDPEAHHGDDGPDVVMEYMTALTNMMEEDGKWITESKHEWLDPLDGIRKYVEFLRKQPNEVVRNLHKWVDENRR